MITFSIEEFKENLVEFEAARMHSAQTVWMNTEVLTQTTGDVDWSREKFANQFAYGISDTPCFAEIQFDPTEKRVFKAERYGGIGVGDNGGGARCGTLGLLNIKGMGSNPLIGKVNDKFHAFGGLGMAEAVAEAINSTVFGHILPLGTVQCYGIIFTGRNAAFTLPPLENGELPSCSGALLIRENCIRPAHFFRNALFAPAANIKAKICGEIYRTRQVNKTLNGKFLNKNDFVKFLGQFLAACANQFAFARIFRIRHGALSPSNFSFDGRWLDLTYMGFIDSGKNYSPIQHTSSFYEEPKEILKFVSEFLYTFEKYNQISFDATPLITYYFEQFEAYGQYYCARLLGLPIAAVDTFGNADAYNRLTKIITSTIISDNTPVLGGPDGFASNDPIVLLVEDLFRALNLKHKLTLTRQNLPTIYISSTFKLFFEHCFEVRTNRDLNRVSFLISAAVKSLRKLYFSCFYYNLDSTFVLAREVANLDKPSDGGDYIDEFCEVSLWLFEDDETDRHILFKSRLLELFYEASNNVYVLNHTQVSTPARFSTAAELKTAIAHLSAADLCIRHFSFKANLLRMLELLAHFDISQP